MEGKMEGGNNVKGEGGGEMEGGMTGRDGKRGWGLSVKREA